MTERPWWQRVEGLPWDRRSDADETTRWWYRESVRRDVAFLAKLVAIAIGVSSVLAFRGSWVAAIVLLGVTGVGTIGALMWWRDSRLRADSACRRSTNRRALDGDA